MIRICLALALCSATLPAFAQPAEVQRTVLIRGESSTPNHESLVARVYIASGATIGRHTHFGDEIGFVQEGELEMYVEGESLRKLKTGDAFIIPSGKVHSARNTGNGPAHVIVTYVIERNRPMAVPAK
ncbi:cupin domain-containing protein [Pseudoduganella sp. S-14]|uniref:cupin domain-containing protein n=1 Tax=Pseudoduganella sp. S-14 TaxID=3404065 RepID=UPI003CF0A941